MIALISAYGLAALICNIFACTPIHYFWNRNIPGHCINLMVYWFCNAVFNIITDIVVCVMPLPVLKDLRLPKKQKYSLLLVFALGGL